jgi:hypothetical protein
MSIHEHNKEIDILLLRLKNEQYRIFEKVRELMELMATEEKPAKTEFTVKSTKTKTKTGGC